MVFVDSDVASSGNDHSTEKKTPVLDVRPNEAEPRLFFLGCLRMKPQIFNKKTVQVSLEASLRSLCQCLNAIVKRLLRITNVSGINFRGQGKLSPVSEG